MNQEQRKRFFESLDKLKVKVRKDWEQGQQGIKIEDIFIPFQQGGTQNQSNSIQ